MTDNRVAWVIVYEMGLEARPWIMGLVCGLALCLEFNFHFTHCILRLLLMVSLELSNQHAL